MSETCLELASVRDTEPTSEAAKGSKGRGGRRPGSGRPKGALNKRSAELKEYAGQFTKEAIDRAVEIMRGDNDAEALKACAMILDRALGKPPQAVTGDEGGPVELVIKWGGNGS